MVIFIFLPYNMVLKQIYVQFWRICGPELQLSIFVPELNVRMESDIPIEYISCFASGIASEKVSKLMSCKIGDNLLPSHNRQEYSVHMPISSFKVF